MNTKLVGSHHQGSKFEQFTSPSPTKHVFYLLITMMSPIPPSIRTKIVRICYFIDAPTPSPQKFICILPRFIEFNKFIRMGQSTRPHLLPKEAPRRVCTAAGNALIE